MGLFDFPPLCLFKCALKWLASEVALHCILTFDFFPLCLLKCALKLRASEDALEFSPLCVVEQSGGVAAGGN